MNHPAASLLSTIALHSSSGLYFSEEQLAIGMVPDFKN